MGSLDPLMTKSQDLVSSKEQTVFPSRPAAFAPVRRQLAVAMDDGALSCDLLACGYCWLKDLVDKIKRKSP